MSVVTSGLTVPAGAAVTPMLGPDLAGFFSRSIEPAQAVYDETTGGSAWVTGAANPLGGDGALRFTDQSAFLAPRIIALLEQPMTTQFRISTRAYNNVHVPGGSRGARLRFGVNEIGLITSEVRVAATITFKQDNTIQAKGDLPGSPGKLLAQPIQLQTAYQVDIIVNVDRVNAFSYTYHGAAMTLDPAAYHLMVDGVLLPEMPATGLPFALTAGADYKNWTESFGGAVDQIGFVSATADDGVDWYFADMVFATGDDVSVAGDPVTPKWAGYDILAGDLVDTGTHIGWLYVGHAPWIYVYSLARYAYMPEEAVSESGLWAFVF